MLRLILAMLLVWFAGEAAPPNRICGGLPYDRLAGDGSPSTLTLVFTGTGAFAIVDGEPADPAPRVFSLNAPSALCTSGLALLPPRATSSASQTIAGGDFNGDGIPDAASIS